MRPPLVPVHPLVQPTVFHSITGPLRMVPLAGRARFQHRGADLALRRLVAWSSRLPTHESLRMAESPKSNPAAFHTQLAAAQIAKLRDLDPVMTTTPTQTSHGFLNRPSLATRISFHTTISPRSS